MNTTSRTVPIESVDWAHRKGLITGLVIGVIGGGLIGGIIGGMVEASRPPETRARLSEAASGRLMGTAERPIEQIPPANPQR